MFRHADTQQKKIYPAMFRHADTQQKKIYPAQLPA
jgi:hypothetical protein